MPTCVQIVEVGPRDGFQNIAEFIPTPVKIAVIEKLIAAGIGKMEITSFVHPKAVPQMSDAALVTEAVLRGQHAGFIPVALVPNLIGARKAWASGVKEVSFVLSVSEAHNEANTRRTRAQSLEELAAIRAELPELKVRVDAATAFGCPFSGTVPEEETLGLIRCLADAGTEEVILCDTIGVADPRQVARLADAARREFPGLAFGLHLHDTRGLGLANALAGLQSGIHTLEVSVGGLGGCPFAPGASGNTATEDLLYMLSRMGIETGVDLERYMEAVALVKERVRAEITGRLAGVYQREAG